MENFKKITEDLYDKNEDFEVEKLLPENVRIMLLDYVNELRCSLDYYTVDCESPIEQMLSIPLSDRIKNGEFDIPGLVDVVDIDKQRTVECGESKYRVDFEIPVIYWNKYQMFVVECDGHEFHQKTKEQVENDNKRTRDLQKAGYEVIRFSGTEIYHRPEHCVKEIKKIIQAPAIEFIEKAKREVINCQ